MIIEKKKNTLLKIISILILIFIELVLIEYVEGPELIVTIPFVIILIIVNPKERIIIEDSRFTIHSKSFLPFLSSKHKFDKNEIIKIEFYPKRINWLIVISPWVYNGFSPAEVRITLTNGKHYETKTGLAENDWDIVRNKLKIKKHSP